MKKKIGIYYSDGKDETLYCNKFFDDKSIVHKILLIPCVRGYEKQSILLFIDKEIHVIKIKEKTIYPKIIDLSKQFHYEKFDEFQFIIYLDFLLILKFEEKNKWIGKIFSLNFED